MSIFSPDLIERKITNSLFKEWNVRVYNINFAHPLLLSSLSSRNCIQSDTWESIDEYIENMKEFNLYLRDQVVVCAGNMDVAWRFAQIIIYMLQDITLADFYYDDYFRGYHLGYRLTNYAKRFTNRVTARCRKLFNIPKNSCIGYLNTHFYIRGDAHSFYDPFEQNHQMDFEIATYSTNYSKKTTLFRFKLIKKA